MVQHEEWRPIPGFPSYEVSSTGRLVSHRRHQGKPGPREIRGGHNGAGYRTARLVGPDGKQVRRYVHHLAAEAFVGPRPAGMEVRHLDGNPLNNAASNLLYGTKSENTLDSVRHGTHNHGRKTHCVHGHPFSPDNTYRSPWQPSKRSCRTCFRLRREGRALRAADVSSGVAA